MAEEESTTKLEAAEKDFDSFFLSHLQSVKSAKGEFYLNQRFVGKGGNGTAFLVTCTSGAHQGTQFALKVFHKISDRKRRDRFLDEIKHYQTLKHPALLSIYDTGTYKSGDREYPFAVVDYVPENFENVVGIGTPRLTRLEALRYVYNVASGVAYLHSQEHPIVHRDIKPANILVHGQSARLGDLGLAKVLMADGGKEEADEVAAYAAMPFFHRTPELVAIARGEQVDLSPASDIYQLGLVLYRSLTGFNPQKRPQAVTDDIHLDVRQLAGASGARLDALVEGMLKSNASDRPSAKQVLQQLNIIHSEVCNADLNATGMMR
ncbi:serine/threonine protein kinase [Gluconacetobacter johannae DSM 13595]|uniref:non-specific serine/threonine protein kinase n=1 Tax=Gluconacetobacter johannae TaxID=112140 RepID=A0A7W4J8E9_9PROT|nr:serine/threonine-protein kinase [Gluconacetobacter johannae]MBB2176590.1 serine/threonine protein kinase [Gluconacetobacter johannae]GBQ80192.1 serine/threonine protein kinase [Gluconacetobacter johannae DSM 13595]